MSLDDSGLFGKGVQIQVTITLAPTLLPQPIAPACCPTLLPHPNPKTNILMLTLTLTLTLTPPSPSP